MQRISFSKALYLASAFLCLGFAQFSLAQSPVTTAAPGQIDCSRDLLSPTTNISGQFQLSPESLVKPEIEQAIEISEKLRGAGALRERLRITYSNFLPRSVRGILINQGGEVELLAYHPAQNYLDVSSWDRGTSRYLYGIRARLLGIQALSNAPEIQAALAAGGTPRVLVNGSTNIEDARVCVYSPGSEMAQFTGSIEVSTVELIQ